MLWPLLAVVIKSRFTTNQRLLAGASGNPLALLNPRLGRIEQSAEHLVTLAWQYAIPHYQKFKAFRPIQVNQLALKPEDDLLELAEQYPHGVFAEKVNQSELETEFPSLKLLQAGTVSPHQLRDQIFSASCYSISASGSC